MARGLRRGLIGAFAAFAVAILLGPVDRAHAAPAGPALASAIKGASAPATVQIRFGGHGGGGGHFHGGMSHFHGGGFGHFHGGGGGFHHFHGGFHRGFGPHFVVGPRFYYGYNPYYYAPVYRCPLVWTAYGPQRICGFRRHHVRYWGGPRWHRWHHRHHWHYHHHRHWR